MGPFVGKPLRAVSLSDVKRLVDNAVTESLHLEYKSQISFGDADKKEFLRDVTAFANADGGTIIFGVDEDRSTGLPKGVNGFALTNADELRLRVEQILKDGIDERLPAYELEVLQVDATNSVLLLRVPSSIRAPHMVVYGGDRRFFVRTNSGKQEMSTSQVRDAVLRADSITERGEGFVQQRLSKWKNGLVREPFWMLHVIPLMRSSALDLTDGAMIRRLSTMKWPVASDHLGHCLEGYKVRGEWHGDAAGITQRITFRNGTTELLDQYAFNKERHFVLQKFCRHSDALPTGGT